MTRAYLTIDDSPSVDSDALIDYLAERNIPALLFCRGDLLDANPEPMIRAVQKGFVLGNHSYAHKPFGDLSFEKAVQDIERAEAIIDKVYQKADVDRPGKYFRFPYIDRGDGDRIERRFNDFVAADRQGTDTGINNDPKVKAIQDYLHQKGFSQPFHNVDHPLYGYDDIKNAADCLFTYSSADWMMTTRHKGQWPYKNVDDLCGKIDDDHHLNGADTNIVLFHDQDELLGVVQSLIDHMVDKGYQFLKIT